MSANRASVNQHPDNDPIRFRNLVRVIQDSLAQKYRSRDTRALLGPIEALKADAACLGRSR
jgi:ribosomal 50S subunit-associated protein YjgA (DUF615 family)